MVQKRHRKPFEQISFKILFSYVFIILIVIIISVAIIFSLNQYSVKQADFSNRVTNYLQNVQLFSNSISVYFLLVERISNNVAPQSQLVDDISNHALETMSLFDAIDAAVQTPVVDEIQSLLEELNSGIDDLIDVRINQIQPLSRQLDIQFGLILSASEQIENIVRRAAVLGELTGDFSSQDSELAANIVENISRAKIAVSLIYPAALSAETSVTKNDFVASISNLVRNNARISDIDVRKQISEQADKLLDSIHPSSGFFSNLENLQTAQDRFSNIVRGNQDIENKLTARLAELVSEANIETQDEIAAISKIARDNLQLAILGAFLTIVIAASIVILFVHPGIVRRLGVLANETSRISNGELDNPIAVKGNDEITDMGHALENFRVQLIEKADIEEERKKLVEILSASNDQLAQFAYICSHDLQEPLRMISAFSSKLEMRLHEVHPDLAEDERLAVYLDQLRKGAVNGQDLIRGVLNYSKLDHEHAGFQPVDCNEIFQEISTIINPGSDITVLEIENELPMVLGVRTQIYQLFFNLVSNGVKYAKPGVPPIVKIKTHDSGEFWAFEVSDNGIGIDAKDHQAIFEIFRRLHRKDEYPGIGIGLSICKKIVDNHRGRIELDSEIGKGSTFRVTLLKG